MRLAPLVGAGDRIMLTFLPFAVVGVAANLVWPQVFSLEAGGPPVIWLGVFFLALGVPVWLTAVVQILTQVPKHRLITRGAFHLARHPLYAAVSLLVVPGLSLVLQSWLGFVLGGVLYAIERHFSHAEEQALTKEFGAAYVEYSHHVLLPWL